MCKGNVCKQFFVVWFGGGEFEDPSYYNYVVGVSFVIIKK